MGDRRREDWRRVEVGAVFDVGDEGEGGDGGVGTVDDESAGLVAGDGA